MMTFRLMTSNSNYGFQFSVVKVYLRQGRNSLLKRFIKSPSCSVELFFVLDVLVISLQPVHCTLKINLVMKSELIGFLYS